MAAERIGSQMPTSSFILPYRDTKGHDAVEIYNRTSREAMPWQELLANDILAIDSEGLWVHSKYGYEIPRRNGKGEVIAIVELWGLLNGCQIAHTAHLGATASSAYSRLVQLLYDLDYSDKPDGDQKKMKCNRAYGRESITIPDTGGKISFKTRTTKGGLGEGFDILIVDEAQEYTVEQESALQYTVTDSGNPLTLFCGTPPTVVSSGTVFKDLRDEIFAGESHHSGWSEWSMPGMVDLSDEDELIEALYTTNPSLGMKLTLRAVLSESRKDAVDFNIQRLGVWIKYNQKSAISESEWDKLQADAPPALKGKLFIGIKYGKKLENVSMSVAVKTADDLVYVETIGCRPIREGTDWLIAFLAQADVAKVVVDGAAGTQIFTDAVKDARLKVKVEIPRVADIITASAAFENGVTQKLIRHSGQPSLRSVVSNCEHRAIGSNGGFGYNAQIEGMDISLMESCVLAFWLCVSAKSERRQQAR